MLLLVDCNTGACGEVIEQYIAPALRAARARGLKTVYLYEDGYGLGGPRDITRELCGTRLGRGLPPVDLPWRPRAPLFPPSLAPRDDEPVLAKSSKDGFLTTNLDYYLKSWGIDTIVAVGFALGSCVYQTCLGARHRNYRVVLLRDCTTPPGHGEFPDTLDPDNPEGGWMRYVFLRQLEASVGYTSTSGEFIAACLRASR